MRTVSLAADINTGKLLNASTKLPFDEIPLLRRGDTVSIELTIYSGGNTYPLPTTGGAYFVGVKPQREPMAAVFLAETETVAAASSKLTFSLALTSPALTVAMAGARERCEAVLEVKYTDDDGRTTLASFRLDILNDYVKGTEGDPPPSAPTYYTAAQVLALLNARISVPDGLRLVVGELGNISVEEITE